MFTPKPLHISLHLQTGSVWVRRRGRETIREDNGKRGRTRGKRMEDVRIKRGKLWY